MRIRIMRIRIMRIRTVNRLLDEDRSFDAVHNLECRAEEDMTVELDDLVGDLGLGLGSGLGLGFG